MRKASIIRVSIFIIVLLCSQKDSTYGFTRGIECSGVVIAYDLFPDSSRRHSVYDLEYYEVVFKIMPSNRNPGGDGYILLRFRHTRSMSELPARFFDGKSIFRVKLSRAPSCDRVVQVSVPVGSEGVVYAQAAGVSWTPGRETETIPAKVMKCFEVADNKPHLEAANR